MSVLFSLGIVLLTLGLTTAQSRHNYNVTSAASSNASHSHRLGIYNGSPTSIKSHPYMASILYNGQFFCASTIVSKSWVVTVGDCAYGVLPSQMKVMVGSDNAYSGTSYLVEKIILHPKYKHTQLDFDYACIQIQGSFQWTSEVQPIALARNRPTDNTPVIAAGWGATHNVEKSASNSAMMQTTMTWLPLSRCANYYSGFPISWSNRMGCAKDLQHSSTLCTGDWGDAFEMEGDFYGMFIGCATKGFCTSQALPVIIASIPAAAPWISAVTGDQYQSVITTKD